VPGSPPTAEPEEAAARGEAAGDGSRLSDYDYALPQERISLRPAEPRDGARLLVHRPGAPIEDRVVRELPRILAPGDRLVINDSRVIPARLSGVRRRGEGGAAVEVTLVEARGPGLWRALARPAKRLRPGDELLLGEGPQAVGARVVARDGPNVLLAFDGDPLRAGVMPLPPYIAGQRPPDARDTADYQTVYADPPGSVAAPTAGLHFTEALLAALGERGIGLTRLTLHVGQGTFLPVTSEAVDGHEMHAEWGAIGAEAVEAIAATRAAGGRIIAVGTTTLRLLETAASGGRLEPFSGETRLFIRPGFRFNVADGLVTNFHLPRSTLLMLVAAFVGLGEMRAIYEHAIASGYRFYSYGDASLLLRR